MLTPDQDIASRPRLDASPAGTGKLPFAVRMIGDAPPPATPHPEPVEGRLDALYERLHTALIGCLISINTAQEGAFPLIAHNELALLNSDLAEARRLNAGLSPQQRSLRAAHWAEPPLAPTRLHGHRDILPFIETALRIVSTTRSRNQSYLHAHN